MLNRENYLQTLEELVNTNLHIAKNYVSEHEARLLAMENMAYQEVIQKIKSGACSFDEEEKQDLEAIWLAEAGIIGDNHLLANACLAVDNSMLDIEHRSTYDRYGLRVGRMAEYREQIFKLYDEEEWGEADEIYRQNMLASQHLTA